jgi:hypothetical protein
MKATSRSILFCRVLVGKQMHLYPVAVFADAAKAKAHAAFLHMAHKSADVETAKKLDPAARVTEDGKLHPGAKFSVTTVPYEPSADIGSEEFEESTLSATS